MPVAGGAVAALSRDAMRDRLNSALAGPCCGGVLCLALFFGIFFGLNYPEVGRIGSVAHALPARNRAALLARFHPPCGTCLWPAHVKAPCAALCLRFVAAWAEMRVHGARFAPCTRRPYIALTFALLPGCSRGQIRINTVYKPATCLVTDEYVQPYTWCVVGRTMQGHGGSWCPDLTPRPTRTPTQLQQVLLRLLPLWVRRPVMLLRHAAQHPGYLL